MIQKVPYPQKKIQPCDLPSPKLIEKIIAAILYYTRFGTPISEKHVTEAPQEYYKIIIKELKTMSSE